MKVQLKVTTYIGNELEIAGSTHELENGQELIEKGIAVEATSKDENGVSSENDEIIADLNLEDEEKAYLADNIGDFALQLKKDGTLDKKSENKVNDILDGMDE